MEFGLREWMILISGLLIIVVIVDGVRRMLADRRHQVRMGMSYHDDEQENDDYFDGNPELPNGGARVLAGHLADSSEPVIGSLDIDDEAPFREHFATAVSSSASRSAHSDADKPAPESSSPLEAMSAEAMSAERLEPDPPPAKFTSADPGTRAEAGGRAERPPRERRKKGSAFRRRGAQTGEAATTAAPVAEEAPPAETVPGSEAGGEATAQQVPAGVAAAEATKPAERAVAKDQPEEVLMINVFARDNNGFNGSDLLEVLLACDVRHGDMNIFHRYEGAEGKGSMQFSVANMVKPGTFDLTTMKTFYTPGITFFMQLPGPADPLAAFDCMAEVASCMVRNLQGEMRDEGHSVLTQQTLEHYRERIRNFERKRLMRAKRKA